MDLRERKGQSIRRHPWEVARAHFFLELLARDHVIDGGTSWLDVGSGDAWFARQLRPLLRSEAELTCWDINYSPEDLAAAEELRDEGVTLVAERPSGPFDRLLLMDVIEHVADDSEFVATTVHDLMADGGMALVSVPAYQSLLSSHDRMLGHYRRYSPASCRRVLEGSGLVVEREGGLFHSLLPVRSAQVLAERARAVKPRPTGIGEWRGGPLLTRIVTGALRADVGLSLLLDDRHRTLPGLSYWALCRKDSAAS